MPVNLFELGISATRRNQSSQQATGPAVNGDGQGRLLQKGKGSGKGIPECSGIATDRQVPEVQRAGSQDRQGYIVEKMGC